MRREPDDEYVSRAGRPKHTTLNLDLPHTFSIGGASKLIPNMQGTIDFAVRNVEYQLFYIFNSRFSEHLDSNINNQDVNFSIQMANTMYDGLVFSFEVNFNTEDASNSHNTNDFLINKFDTVFFSDANRIHNSWTQRFDEFKSLEYIYNITSNGFLVIATFYLSKVNEQIQQLLPLPPKQRELFLERLPISEEISESATEFAERVWGDYISANRLHQEHIIKLDYPLFNALLQLSNSGDIAIHKFIRNTEINAAKKISDCIAELEILSKTNPDLNETLLRRLLNLKKEVGNRLTEGT